MTPSGSWGRAGPWGPWVEQAACLGADTEIFYPTRGGPASPAKRVCNGDDERPPCPVRDECLSFALENNERFGVWGGLSERERWALRRRGAA